MMYLAVGFVAAAAVMAFLLMILAAFDRRILFEKLYNGVFIIWVVVGSVLSAVALFIHRCGFGVGVGLE